MINDRQREQLWEAIEDWSLAGGTWEKLVVEVKECWIQAKRKELKDAAADAAKWKP